MAVLKQISGVDRVPEHVVSKHTSTIGRHSDCDITIESPAASRQHAQIIRDDGRYFIEDLNSRNGTLVNGNRLRTRMLLYDGDRIEISSHHFLFPTRDSLSVLSGSWGERAQVIHVSNTIDKNEDSVRRQTVDYEDLISAAELGTDSLESSQMLARIHSNDSGIAWPVVSNSTEKLNYALRLLHSLRKSNSTDEVIRRCFQFMFDTFSSAERISLVLRDDNKNGVRVIAAVSRTPGDVVEICLPVVRATMQTSDAVLFLDHSKKTLSRIPELETPAIRFIMAAPLAGLLGRSFGVIQIDTQNTKQPLAKDDLELLVILTHVMSSAVEQSRDSQIRLSKTLADSNLKSSRQQHLLTDSNSAPFVPGYRISRQRIQNHHIGSDFIDYVKRPDGTTACILADVTHPTNNATNEVALVSRLLTEAVCNQSSTNTAMNLTQVLLESRATDFKTDISVALLILNTERSSVPICMAGEFPLYHVRQNVLTQIDCSNATGPPLQTPGSPEHLVGVKSEHDALISPTPNCYQQMTVALQEDDRLLVFTKALQQLNERSESVLTSECMNELLSESNFGSNHTFESRLRERITLQHGDSEVGHAIAFATIHKMRQTTKDDTLTATTAADAPSNYRGMESETGSE